MNKSKLVTVASVIAIGFVLFLPSWLEVKRAREAAAKFFSEANQRQVEAKVVMAIKEIENPFTWGTGKPTMVAARKAVDDSFLVLFADLSERGQGTNKAFVSADCSKRELRVVTQEIYEKYLTDVGYDILGKKLPTWESADYYAMLAVKLGQASSPAGKSVFFSIACKWDSYGPAVN